MQSTYDAARDFDFWMGSWQVRNRRLRRRLEGCGEWDEFEATVVARPLAGGLGNVDEFRTAFWPGFVGMTCRLYDPATRLWSIYWVDTAARALLPPVVGRFDEQTGIFEGDDTCGGRAVRVRFTWTRGEAPRWEQAFSPDGGRTWETNWVMEMTRARQPAPVRLDVVELRRYRVAAGQRDRFVRRFDAVVPDVFDQLRAPILGQFADRGSSESFVWLRGFESYDDMAPVKTAYYDGPHWALHTARTNALLADSDDALLLRAVDPLEPPAPLDPESDAPPAGVVVCVVATGRVGGVDALIAALREKRDVWVAAGARQLGLFATLDRPNPFPRHPFRTDGPYVTWLGVVDGEEAVVRLRRLIAEAEAALAPGELLAAPFDVRVLDPTPRSRWR